VAAHGKARPNETKAPNGGDTPFQVTVATYTSLDIGSPPSVPGRLPVYRNAAQNAVKSPF
jgi:hypothetical protein